MEYSAVRTLSKTPEKKANRAVMNKLLSEMRHEEVKVYADIRE